MISSWVLEKFKCRLREGQENLDVGLYWEVWSGWRKSGYYKSARFPRVMTRSLKKSHTVVEGRFHFQLKTLTIQ